MTLADDLAPLRPEFMAAPFWFWNDVMDPREVRRQIGEMASRNIGGFFMHARMGRVTPYMSSEWMAAIKAAVDEARKFGIEAWIYDEDGWPSGFGGGLVNALGEDYLQQYAMADVVACSGGKCPEIDDRDMILAAFAARKTPEGFDNVQRVDPGQIGKAAVCQTGASCDHVVLFRRELHNYRRFFSPECWADGYVDILNPKVTRAFIRKIYEAYRREIGDAFGSTVPGVFTDEPSYHEREWMGTSVRLPFSPVLEREFEKRFKAPLRDCLMTIAFGGQDSIGARWCYYSALAHLFANNFTKILADWCDKHDLTFTGHYLLEECPRAATQVIGDVMQHYAYQQYPGIDHLGKDIDLSKDFWTSARVLVKQAASVAHQLDKPRVMCETYAGGGWDFGVSEQKWMGDWQYALGLNLCCQHAFHYSLRGFRKRDYPPSLSFQQPWWPFSADLGAHFARLGYLLTRGQRVVNVLIMHPIESFFATHDVTDYPWSDDALGDGLKDLVRHLLAAQIDFDFGNEVLLKKHGRVEGSQVVIGTGRYDVVIVPHSLTWRKSTLAALRKFTGGGGRLFFVEPVPTHVEGEPSEAYEKLFRQATGLGPWNDDHFERQVVDHIAPVARHACQLAGDRTRDVVAMHRRTDRNDIFFLASAAKEPHAVRATFSVPGRPLLLDTTTGRLSPLSFARQGDDCHVDLEFDFARSFPIVFDAETTAAAIGETCVQEKRLCGPGDALAYHVEGDNALVLDRCELFIDGQSAGEMLTLDAQLKLADRPGEPPDARLRFVFNSSLPVATASVLLETPEEFRLTVNDRPVPVSSDGDWVIDPCLRRLAIPGGLRAGENVVEIAFRWHDKLELEPLYVLGRFGTCIKDDRPCIGPLPDRLAVGSWHEQGLTFYAGCVSYPFDVDIEDGIDRWEIHCPQYRGAIRVLAGGVEAGTILWAPHRLNLTQHLRPGRNWIELQVASSLRNFLGPHHLGREDEIDCLGPQNFFETETRTRHYRLKPAGLLGEVTLRGYRK